MNPITVHLTDIEAQAIIQFVELGIKSVGGQAARIGLPIQDKIALAIDVAKKANDASQPAPANAGGEPSQP